MDRMTFHEHLIGADPKGDAPYIARFWNAIICGILGLATAGILLATLVLYVVRLL